MEELNMVNDMQEGFVGPHEPGFAASAADTDLRWDDRMAQDARDIPEDVADLLQEPERTAQTPEENAAFASMRRRQEQLERELAARDELLGKFFEDADDPYLAGLAYAENLEPDELLAALYAEQELARRDAELEELREYRAQSIFSSDLNKIKALFPEEQAETIDELGEDFIAIMATGTVDPVTAYMAVREKRQRDQRLAPPEVGRVNAGAAAGKDYYTREEVRRMSPEAVHRNWDKIQRSRKRWK